MPNRASLLQLAGLVALTVGAFLLSVVAGVFVAGVCLLVLGVAEELR